MTRRETLNLFTTPKRTCHLGGRTSKGTQRPYLPPHLRSQPRSNPNGRPCFTCTAFVHQTCLGASALTDCKQNQKDPLANFVPLFLWIWTFTGPTPSGLSQGSDDLALGHHPQQKTQPKLANRRHLNLLNTLWRADPCEKVQLLVGDVILHLATHVLKCYKWPVSPRKVDYRNPTRPSDDGQGLHPRCGCCTRLLASLPSLPAPDWVAGCCDSDRF